jgi:hypothetical protein
MDQTPEPLPTSPPHPPPTEEARFDALLRRTITEQVRDVAPAPNALPRLNARLDAARPLTRWPLPLRWAGAAVAALLLLAFLTPVGHLAAAGVHNATQTIITTVKQIASGDNGAKSTPPNTPSATSALGSRTAPTNDVGSPTSSGTANPAPATATRAGTPSGTASQVAPLPPSPRATAQPTGTPLAINTRLESTPPTATEPPAASTPVMPAGSGAATPTRQTEAPAAKPSALLTATPVTHGPKTVAPPGRDAAGEADKNRGTQCTNGGNASAACRKNAPPARP